MASKSLSRAFQLTKPLRTYEPTAFFQACRTQSHTLTNTTPRTQRQSRQVNLSQPPSRHFSSTKPSQATVIKQNPRVDDDGKEMNIIISERAAKRLKQIVSTPPKKNTLAAAPAQQDSHLRVTVTAGGCHGFQYLMALEPADKVDVEEDTIFEFEDPGEGAKAEVVMDQPSLELLKGSTIDFTTELIGSQFKIVGNPRATSSCGCGTSFDIE